MAVPTSPQAGRPVELLTGLHVAVDGVGLTRPWAGVGVYTTQILRAMAVERPDCRFTVYIPGLPATRGGRLRPGTGRSREGRLEYPTSEEVEGTRSTSYRQIPEVPFIGRHVQWPARLRRLQPDVFFGAAGALPLMDVGSSSVITVHDLAIYLNAGWFPPRQPLSTRRLGDRVLDLDAVEPTHLPAMYNLARVLAHPAWYEGCGLPPLEAMACGTPVVVSDRSSLPEVVGDAGLVVAAGDADAWRQALEKVIGDQDLAADLRRRGILRAAEFSWSRSAAMTWGVIDDAGPERAGSQA